MSKGYSGHFLSTKGDIHEQGTIKSKQLEKIITWAKSKIESMSNRKAREINTATMVYDEATGKFYYGINKGIELNNSPKNPIIFGDKNHTGLLPKDSLNNYPIGNCSEVDAINNALNDGSKLSDLHILTIHTTKHMFGQSKVACENCTFAFKGRVKSNNSGWEK